MSEVTITRNPQEYVRYLLRRLAVEITKEGTLNALAEKINVDPTTIWRWSTRGAVPRRKAVWLQTTFGETLCPAEHLSPPGTEETEIDQDPSDLT